MTVSLYFDLPPRELSPNARIHWAKKAKAVKDYRWRCRVDALMARPRGMVRPLTPPVTATVTFYVKRAQDADNLVASFKAGIDGIRDAGLIEDDSADKLKLVPSVVVGKAKGVSVVLS